MLAMYIHLWYNLRGAERTPANITMKQITGCLQMEMLMRLIELLIVALS